MIFSSYCRADSKSEVGRIYSALKSYFPTKGMILDHDNILSGAIAARNPRRAFQLTIRSRPDRSVAVLYQVRTRTPQCYN